MSIKDLFEKKKTKPVVRQTKADIAKDAESIETSAEKIKKEHVYIPQVDFSDPENFAFYGSAKKYYSDSFKTIVGTYPYDGSEEEVLEFRNGMNYVERYIFDNLYPKTNGYGLFSADGWGGASTPSGEYGVPTSQEYIYVFGGPLSASSGMDTQSLKFSFSASNLFQEDIYDVVDENPAGRLGTRESNLKYDLDKGSTVEFWLQKDAFDISKTKKEVVFDLWNQTAYTDSGYGRLMVELSGNNDFTDGSPFFITANSGSTGFNNTKIGTNITTASLSSWHHYAFSFVNDRSASKIRVKFYVDGVLNDEKAIGAPLNEVTGGLKAFIGAMQAPVIGGTGVSGAGKLSGSLDEFRYWKAKRTSEDVGFNYFRPVRGGTNDKVSNATLGIYYKFNEGITQTSSIDSVVLDYSGRVANGQWVGYDAYSRSTGSAIVLAGAYSTEEKDPIIYGIHPSVSSLRSSLELSGSLHDENNNNRFIELFPSWMKDKAFETGDPSFDNLTQMMGVEFDKTFLLINRITELKKQNYFNDDQTAFPFIKQMLESYGLTAEDLLSAAEINEKVLNKNDTQNLENDIQDVKNKLYQNLFNNLFNIYKTKGTEKSFRNIFRCLGLDDDLIAIKIYADNTTYTLDDNYKNKLLRAVHVDHNKVDNFGATIHQWYTSSNPNTISFISGSNSTLEYYLGFTAECKFILPSKPRVSEPHYFRTPFVTSSLFGMNTATDDDQTDLTYRSTNSANFSVVAERDSIDGRNARFRLSSTHPFPIPELTTSFYNNLYSNTEWSIGVSMRPIKPLGDFVPGSQEIHATSSRYDSKWLVEFYGVNMLGKRVLNEFFLTSTVNPTRARSFLHAPKRMYLGAHYTNFTGTLVNRTDAKFDSLKYYNLYNDTASIKQHMIDQESYGRADSLEQVNLFATGTLDTYIPKFKTLILNWNFRNLSSSKADGTFFVDDFSSGSADDESYGAYKGYFNKQHSGIGRFFLTSSTKNFDKVYVNSMQKQTPETTMASDMVNILERDDERYIRDSKAVRYSVHFEKSPYEAINKEILNMFSTVMDFNNAVGSSVERYRQEYKSLENLRRLMFSRFQNEVNVEKFISYYRWFDHAVGRMLEEFIPGSVKYEASLATLIQSHVLERNKYWTKFPTMEFKTTDPEAGLAGYEELNYDWKHGHAPVSNKQAFNSIWWKNRAERDKGLLSSSFATANFDREKIRMEIQSFRSASAVFLAQSSSLPAGYIPVYRGREFPLRKFTKHYDFSVAESKVIHGGVNFNKNKDFHYAFNAVHPAGPVSTLGGRFVPQNVLLGFRSEDYDKQNIKDVFKPNEKKKVFGKVLFGRDYEDGTKYTNTDMNHAFPFNVYESTVTGGYGDIVNTKYATGTIITNLHSDAYGPDLEVPMQGPFTEKWVGGLQARHVDINSISPLSDFSGGLDDHSTRPEAWKLLLGTCKVSDNPSTRTGKGAIGLAGADYPWPTDIANREAIKYGTSEAVYPMTSSRKAHYYRDEFAKRPLNIKNIRTMTGAVSHGNYRFNYEVIHSVGANQNPRAFLRNTPVLPFQISPGRNIVIVASSLATSNASDGDTITLSDGIITKVLTFKTTPSSPDHVLIGSDYRFTMGNLQANINLSQSWGLRAYNWGAYGGSFGTAERFRITNIAYQGDFTNVAPSTTWSNLEIGISSSSPNIAKTGDITNVLTIRNIFRDQYGHRYIPVGIRRNDKNITRFETRDIILSNIRLPPDKKYDYDYDVSYLTGASAPKNKTIIKSRFAAPGGIETDTVGYRDFRGDEYSAYTPVPYRNLRVIRPDQPTHKIIPDVSGSSAQEQGGPGIRVYDQNGFDIGLRSNLARHTARFGRDSLIYPPTQYRLNDSPDTYNLREALIGYGSKAVYRAQKDLEGWWRLDNYLMQGAVTGNIDSSGKGRSFPFDSSADAPSVDDGGRYVDSNKPLIDATYVSSVDLSGPSPYVQTASFVSFPNVFSHDGGVKFPIGPGTLWESLIGRAGTRSFTFAAWIRPTSSRLHFYGRIFSFGSDTVAFYIDDNASGGKLALQYYSVTSGGGGEKVLAKTPTNSLKGEFPSYKNRWIHVAVTVNLQGTDIRPTNILSSSTDSIFGGQRVKFYINGEKQTTVDNSTGSINTDGGFYGILSTNCFIGNTATGNGSFAGNIADAAVWSVPLAEEDIKAIYNASLIDVPAWGEQRNTGSTHSQNAGVPPTVYGAGPGSTYDQCASLHKIHRNSKRRVINEPITVHSQHKNALWIANAYSLENNGESGFTANSSSLAREQFTVVDSVDKKMIFSFWLKDRSKDTGVNSKTRNIIALNAPMTGAYSDNKGAKQIFAIQVTEASAGPRRMAFRFGSGENQGNASNMKTWYTTDSVVPSDGTWNHFVVATDGWAGPGPRVWVNGVSASIQLENHGGSKVGSFKGRFSTSGGGKFLIGGNAYGYRNANSYQDENNDLYIDEVAMWRGTGTSSLTTAGQIAEIYNSGQYKNLNATSLGRPHAWYRMGDDVADLQSGSITNGLIFQDSSGNDQHLVAHIDGRSAGRILAITASTFGTSFSTTTFKDNFKAVREYDNYYVQHQIPRSDAQYAWITASFTGSEIAEIKVGYAPYNTWEDGLDNNGNSPYNTLLSSSLVNEYFESNNRISPHYTNIYAIKWRGPPRSLIKGAQTFDAPNILNAESEGSNGGPVNLGYGITVAPNRRPDTYFLNNIKRRVNPYTAYQKWGSVLFLNTVSPARELQWVNNEAVNTRGGRMQFTGSVNYLKPFRLTGSVENLFSASYEYNSFLRASSLEFPDPFTFPSSSTVKGILASIGGSGQEKGAINPKERYFRTGPSASVMLNPDVDRLNLYLTRLNGPYGGANFKFIRNQDNKILQNSRHYNLYTAIGSPNSLAETASIFARRSSEIIFFDRVSPVTSKYGSLTYGFGTTRTFKNKFNQDIEIQGISFYRASFANQKTYFNNDKLNMFLGLDNRENLTFYDKFKNLYLDGALEGDISPIERMEFLTYNETIYPSSRNMYSRFNRIRPNFDMSNWRSNYFDRLTTPVFKFQFSPAIREVATDFYREDLIIPITPLLGARSSSLGSASVRVSKWPLDVMGQYYSSSQGDIPLVRNRCHSQTFLAVPDEPWNPGFNAGGPREGGASNRQNFIDQPAGRLLNNTTHWHGGTLTNTDNYLTTGQHPRTGSQWHQKLQMKASVRHANMFITASCIYALKNVSFHSNSVYAWNRPNVVFYQTASDDGMTRAGGSSKAIGLPAKYPNRKGDNVLMAYNTQTAFKYNGYGDAPFIVGETAGKYVFNTASLENTFVSASVSPFYDNYEDFALDIRTKNKDMSVLPEFRISNHIETFSNVNDVLDATLPKMFEIPGAHTFETGIDGTDLDSRSSSGSFFQIYSNSDFLENFEIINNDHKDFMEPSTLTLRCTAIKKFMPYKGFYPAERTVQLYDQFMRTFSQNITQSQHWPATGEGLWKDIIEAHQLDTGSYGAPFYPGVARPVITPLFAPGILFNSIKSGIGVDFPVLVQEGSVGPRARNQISDYDNAFGAKVIEEKSSRTTTIGKYNIERIENSGPSESDSMPDYTVNTITEYGAKATQNRTLNANRITASLTLPPFYSDLSGSVDYYTGSGFSHDRRGNPIFGRLKLGRASSLSSPDNQLGGGNFTLRDRYIQIVGTNRPGTLDWSRRIPFEAIIKPEQYLENLELIDMFVQDTTAMTTTDKVSRFNTQYMSGVVPTAKLMRPKDELYTLMADNFCGAVPDFYLEDGELATITSKKQSELDLFIKSGSIFATRIRMRRSMNKPRNYKNDLRHVFHTTASIDFVTSSTQSVGKSQVLQLQAGDATVNYIREEGQKRQIADYEIFQDPIYDTGLYETLTMYNRPGAFGPPVTGRESDCFAGQTQADSGITEPLTQQYAALSSSRASDVAPQNEACFPVAESFQTFGNKIDFSSASGSRGTNAVRDSSTGFNPAFTPPYYDGHAVLDIVFRADETKEYTLAEIIAKSETQNWRWDPGWLVNNAAEKITSPGRLHPSASFTLIPGDIAYRKDLEVVTGEFFSSGVTGTFGPAYNITSGSNNPGSTKYDPNTKGARLYGGAPYAGQHINQTSMQLENCINFNMLATVPSTTTDNEGNLTIRDVGRDNDKIWVIQPKWETPILNFKDAQPYPQGEGLSTNGIGPQLTVNNRASLVASTGMWHQFGRLPTNNEGIFLEMIDIPDVWLDGHWSLRKNMNRGDGIPEITLPSGVRFPSKPATLQGRRARQVAASFGYNTPYTCSAYDHIESSKQVQSLKDLLGFKSSAQSSNLTLASEAVGPKVRLGELAEKKVLSEAVVAIPFIEKGREKFFFEIDKFFIDMARADRSPPGGVPDAGDSIKDMVEKMERYVLPPSMDFITYPEITPFSMYIFEFKHEFDKQDLANMWQNVAPTTARTFEIAESKIRHDLNQDELMGFALGKSDQAFMDEVRWMVFKVKQKSLVSYQDKIAGKNVPKLSFKLASPMQIMPKFSKFKIRRVRLFNNSLTIKRSTITPTFKFGRSLTQKKTDVELSYNWPYDFFSIVEMAKIKASLTFKKPDDVEAIQPRPQTSGLTPLGPVAPQEPQVASPAPTPQSAVKASTGTRVRPKNSGIQGGKQKQVSVNKKSNVASKVTSGLKFSKVFKF